MRVTLRLSSPTSRTFRVASVAGLYDYDLADEQTVDITAELPLEEQDWSVGAIVGASGTGKSSIARHVWPDRLAGGYRWDGLSILDDFPDSLSAQDVTQLLTAVGFSSTPAWMRPYSALSTGQRFRAELARALADGGDTVVVDEFTSVVDRTVAKAASVAVARHVRRHGHRFVAVTCHHDVLPWLEADWVLDTDRGTFDWTRGRLRRPSIPIRVYDATRADWPMFRGHHYLSRDIAGHARCWLVTCVLDGEERVCAFASVINRLGSRGVMRGWVRGHRHVVLPDFQGLGIGNRMIELIAETLWATERTRYAETSSSPSLIAHRRRRPGMWLLERAPSMKTPSRSTSRKLRTSAGRLTVTFAYVPEALRQGGP